MADSFLTTANVLTMDHVDWDGIASDVFNSAPVLFRIAADTRPGSTFYYTRKTADPTVGFRSGNAGRFFSKSTLEKVTVTCGILDASFAVDVAVAQAADKGEDYAMAQEALSHLQAAFYKAENQMYYGTSEGDAAGFSGLADVSGLVQVSAGANVSTTSPDGSSVWLIRTSNGVDDLEIIWGENGAMSVSERTLINLQDGSNMNYPAYYHAITSWVGLKVGSTYSAVRLCNLSATDTLTDDLISSAMAEFPAGRGPNLIAMSRRSLTQLQQSRTATNATGAPAPFPTESFGVPIVVTDAISDTESQIS